MSKKRLGLICLICLVSIHGWELEVEGETNGKILKLSNGKHAIITTAKDKVKLLTFDIEGNYTAFNLTLNWYPLRRFAVAPTDDGGVFIFGTVGKTDKKVFVGKIHPVFAKNWQKAYSNFTHTFCPGRGMKQITGNVYIVSGWDKTMSTVGFIMALNNEGNFLWIRTRNNLQPIYDFYIMDDDKENEDIIAALMYESGANIFGYFPNGTLKEEFGIRLTNITSIRRTTDKGLIITGLDWYTGEKLKHNAIFKVDNQSREEWYYIISESIGLTRVFSTIEISEGKHAVLAEQNYNYYILLGSMNNGSTEWQFPLYRLGTFKSVLASFVQISPKEFIMLALKYPYSAFNQIVTKIGLPEDYKLFKCEDFRTCGRCSIGYYWKYAKCVSCPPGCSDCIDSQHCLSCGNRYVMTNEHLCAPINETKGSLLPECELNLTHTINNKKSCVCPKEAALDNGTHCIKLFNETCPALCKRCILDRGNYSCIQCNPNRKDKTEHRR
eukprot:TRINITY_DN120343_c0_g1_i1.p1 TRINITY_DN120343_c0_g1~~TRINITY_DN120343_c0_g1_i1.p1  ORF type:complete len:496 (-),score=23.53 TRINITY_DN120343_c0_g1_i1:405-1892(-)